MTNIIKEYDIIYLVLYALCMNEFQNCKFVDCDMFTNLGFSGVMQHRRRRPRESDREDAAIIQPLLQPSTSRLASYDSITPVNS